jgi:hypothetical protein
MRNETGDEGVSRQTIMKHCIIGIRRKRSAGFIDYHAVEEAIQFLKSKDKSPA